MSVETEFQNASAQAPHLYRVHGKHRLKIIEMREGVSKRPETEGQPMYVITCEVVASDNPALRPEDRVAIVQVRQRKDTGGKYWIKVKSVIAAALDKKERDVTHAWFTKAVSAAQPLTGKMFDAIVSDAGETILPATGAAPACTQVTTTPTAVCQAAPVPGPTREPGSDDDIPF
jgi:hypothetical protein